MNRNEQMMTSLWPTEWDGHEQAQLLRLARLTLPEKLDWLEQAHQLVMHMNGYRAKSVTPGLTAQSVPASDAAPEA